MYQDQRSLDTDIYRIRRLQEDEAHLYKRIRLEAIRAEPAMFRHSSPGETDLLDTEWQERIKYSWVVFGLFHKNSLIGMTSIRLLNDELGYLGQSYIRHEHRGLGLSRLLYKARLDYAFKVHLKQLKVSHRETNIISRAAILRSGFKYSYRETANWLDGTTGDVLYYLLELKLPSGI